MFKHCLTVFLVSMVPLVELRGAIPYGVLFGLPLWLTFVIAILGNMLPVPFIYLFARRILLWGKDKPVIGRFFTFCLEKGERGGEKLQAKAGRWAVLGAAAVRRDPPAGNRRVDRNARGEHPEHGAEEEHARVHGGVLLAGCIMAR